MLGDLYKTLLTALNIAELFYRLETCKMAHQFLATWLVLMTEFMCVKHLRNLIQLATKVVFFGGFSSGAR